MATWRRHLGLLLLREVCLRQNGESHDMERKKLSCRAVQRTDKFDTWHVTVTCVSLQ